MLPGSVNHSAFRCDIVYSDLDFQDSLQNITLICYFNDIMLNRQVEQEATNMLGALIR